MWTELVIVVLIILSTYSLYRLGSKHSSERLIRLVHYATAMIAFLGVGYGIVFFTGDGPDDPRFVTSILVAAAMAVLALPLCLTRIILGVLAPRAARWLNLLTITLYGAIISTFLFWIHASTFYLTSPDNFLVEIGYALLLVLLASYQLGLLKGDRNR